MRRFALAGVLLGLAGISAQLNAQVMASERASVSQTIDGTTTTVKYSRPRARGRTGLIGTQVPWGEVWTPGANQATTLSVSKDVSLEGQPVPRGTYSVWIVVNRGPWEMVLDKDTTLFHTQRPKPRAGQIRFPVTREKRPFMEALTWWFPDFSASGGTLALQWDTVYVPVRLRVTPSYSTAVTPQVARRIVGVYQLSLESEPVSTDTTLHRPIETNAREVTLTVRQQGNELRAVMDPPLYRTEEGYRDWIVLPTKGGWFKLGRINSGVLVEVFDYLQIQFDSAGDVAQGFEVRLPNDQLFGKGTRRTS
jgi:hypothetical protein